ncbi:MAG TPA: hypothetical protein VHO46_05705 [Bacteroidales bacterium]|nr:hypothetical protein [Bacteroidales bacterium]
MIVLILQSCSKPDESGIENRSLRGIDQSVSITRSERCADPFEINNIKSALRNLQEADLSLPDIKLEANNVYIRFLPRNEAELELLKQDTTLILFDFPLDSDITDTSFISGNQNRINYQYSVVPLGKSLPGVFHEVLYEVFIPPDTVSVLRSSSGLSNTFYDRLIDESARITGNSDIINLRSTKSSGKRWKPGGRIRAWDDLLGIYIPVTHANVHARWFTHVATALTDDDGYFKMKSFSHAVNYSIKWENSLFTIRDGIFFQAWYNGPKMKGDWKLDIAGGKSKMFATIHRAAYKQFYGDNLGMFRPGLKPGARTKICYMEGNGTGRFIGDFSTGGILPDIQVWGNSNRRLSNIIFGVVSHELGHQAHSIYIGNIRFVQTSKLIRESWAEAVEWAMTNDEYNKLGMKYGIHEAISYDHLYNKHVGWPLVYDKDYSPIFIDLIDIINQRDAKGPDHPNDLISSYTISYINNNLLRNSGSINSLFREVENHKVEGVDDYKIKELFRMYLDQPATGN